jgi:hypothetical protein
LAESLAQHESREKFILQQQLEEKREQQQAKDPKESEEMVQA